MALAFVLNPQNELDLKIAQKSVGNELLPIFKISSQFLEVYFQPPYMFVDTKCVFWNYKFGWIGSTCDWTLFQLTKAKDIAKKGIS